MSGFGMTTSHELGRCEDGHTLPADKGAAWACIRCGKVAPKDLQPIGKTFAEIDRRVMNKLKERGVPTTLAEKASLPVVSNMFQTSLGDQAGANEEE